MFRLTVSSTPSSLPSEPLLPPLSMTQFHLLCRPPKTHNSSPRTDKPPKKRLQIRPPRLNSSSGNTYFGYENPPLFWEKWEFFLLTLLAAGFLLRRSPCKAGNFPGKWEKYM